MNKDLLLARATAIKNESQPSANTAERIGSLFSEIITAMPESVSAPSSGGLTMYDLQNYAFIYGNTVHIGDDTLTLTAGITLADVASAGYVTQAYLNTNGYRPASISGRTITIGAESITVPTQASGGSSSVSWSDITNKPNTLGGLGITDTYISGNYIFIGGIGVAIPEAVAPGITLADVENAGYAKSSELASYRLITNGVFNCAITANAGVAIAQNQALSIGSINLTYDGGYLKTNATIMPASDNVQLGTSTMQFQRVRAKTISNSTANDLIIAQANTDYAINLAVGADANTILAVKATGAELPSGKTLKIGGATLSWDAANGALKVNAPLYSEGWMSAFGVNANGGTALGQSRAEGFLAPAQVGGTIMASDKVTPTSVYDDIKKVGLLKATDTEGNATYEAYWNATMGSDFMRCVRTEDGNSLVDYGKLALMGVRSIQDYIAANITNTANTSTNNSLARRIALLEAAVQALQR